jgi:hypothetical protein
MFFYRFSGVLFFNPLVYAVEYFVDFFALLVLGRGGAVVQLPYIIRNG